MQFPDLQCFCSLQLTCSCPRVSARDVLHHCLEHPGINVTEALEADREAYRDESECTGEKELCEHVERKVC